MKKKIMLCILNAYERDGIADINFDNLSPSGIGKDSMKNYINQLIESKDIENLSAKGYYPRYKIITKIPCPNFMFDDSLTIGNKVVLMESIDKLKSFEKISTKEIAEIVYGEATTSNAKKFYTIKENSGKTIFEILANLEYIKKEPAHERYPFKFNNLGMQIDSYSIDVKSHKCVYCGEEDVEKFYSNKKTVCKNCTTIRTSEKLYPSAEVFLYRKVKNSSDSRSRLKGVVPEKEEIKQQLEKQGYKDYYTGLDFNNVEEMSVDRLDSNKQYTCDNIVITNKYINMMKNDLSIEEFKKFIIDIYNNIDNF